MIITASKYSGACDKSSPAKAVGYLVGTTVTKTIGQHDYDVVRDPVPETLFGDAQTTGRFLTSLPFAPKYLSMTASFAADEIDARAFSAGRWRREAGHLVATILDASYAGIPGHCRPPVFINTHVDTGRLEINFLLPRAVIDGRARLKSFTPFPPREIYTAFRVALQEALIDRFSLCDPDDPLRTQLFRFPDWLHKEHAGALRERLDGHALFHLIEQAVTAAEHGLVHNRDDLIERLVPDLAVAGFKIDHLTPTAVTINQIAGGKSLWLRGFCFTNAFRSAQDISDLRDLNGPMKFERVIRLRTAKTRFIEYRNRYANERAHKESHPKPGPIADLADIPRVILPACHPDEGHSYDERIPLYDSSALTVPSPHGPDGFGTDIALAEHSAVECRADPSGREANSPDRGKPIPPEAHHREGPRDPRPADHIGYSQVVHLVGQLKPIFERTMARIRRNRMVVAIAASLEVHAAAALPTISTLIATLEDTNDGYDRAQHGHPCLNGADSRPHRAVEDLQQPSGRTAPGPRSAGSFGRDPGSPHRGAEDRGQLHGRDRASDSRTASSGGARPVVLGSGHPGEAWTAGGAEQRGPRPPRAPDARTFRRLTRADMIRVSHHQADAFGERLTGLRFTADELGSLMILQIGDQIWQHDGRRFDPIDPEHRAESDPSLHP